MSLDFTRKEVISELEQFLRWAEAGGNLIAVSWQVEKSDGRCLFDWLWIGIDKRAAGGNRGKGRVLCVHWQVFGREELPVRVES